MARLRYVAYIARDADNLPRFYADHLGLSELGRSADGDVSVTDPAAREVALAVVTYKLNP